MSSTLPSQSTHALIAHLDRSRVGFLTTDVQSILRAVAIEPLAGAPSVVEGAINVRGTPIPVIDLRACLGLPPVELRTSQFLVVLEVNARQIAVRVDDVSDVVDIPQSELVAPAAVSPTLKHVRGVVGISDGTLVLYDAATFLNSTEQAALDAALAERTS